MTIDSILEKESVFTLPSVKISRNKKRAMYFESGDKSFKISPSLLLYNNNINISMIITSYFVHHFCIFTRLRDKIQSGSRQDDVDGGK